MTNSTSSSVLLFPSAKDVDAPEVSLKPNPDYELSSLVTLTEQGREVTEQLFQRSEASRTALLDRAAVSVDELHEARRIVRSLLTSFAEETSSVSGGR